LIEQIEALISEEEITIRVNELAKEIEKDYEGLPITLIGTLTGAIFFLTDLSRKINLQQEIDFLKASSYGDGTTSTGDVRLILTPKLQVEGRHVILIEDIVDTGYTSAFLVGFLEFHKPASLKLCALLSKPDRRVVHGVNIDYLGFSIPDEFVVGYGLDCAQKYRNLPFIGVYRNEVT